MFYSHTFLARKGPLGTVWIAAHLEGKLKKSHYTSTDINSTVDRIMYPEVPIALRMSGFLLLGIVRIYSKKADYLYNDCKLMEQQLRNAFVVTDINLPESATHAQFEAVTLPETFQLDALDLDEYVSMNGTQDDHMRSQEDITLVDQVPTDMEPYVAITFDDDIMIDVLHTEPEAGVQVQGDPTETENVAENQNEPDSSLRLRNADPSDRLIGLPSPLNQAKSPAEPSPSLVQIIAEQEVQTPAPASLDSEPLYQQHSEIPSSAGYEGVDMTGSHISFGNDTLQLELQPSPTEAHISTEKAQQSCHGEDANPTTQVQDKSPAPFELPRASPPTEAHISTKMAQQSCPAEDADLTTQVQAKSPPPAELPRARRRKRKLFDKITVLTNRFMKELSDCKDLVHKRRKLPCAALDVWRNNNKMRGERIFFEPLITGMCDDLQNVAKRDFITSKAHLLLPTDEEELHTNVQMPIDMEIDQGQHHARPDSVVDQGQHHAGPDPVDQGQHHVGPDPVDQIARSRSLSPTQPMEIERLRDTEPHVGPNLLDDVVPPGGSHSRNIDDQTSLPAADMTGQVLEHCFMETPEVGSSTDPFSSGQARPAQDIDDIFLGERTGGSDISPLDIRVADELAFLEEDNGSPAKSQRRQGKGTMSARTRAVAQYLSRHSSASQNADSTSGDICLNRLLEGRSKKVCARMFYETLNLKTCALIDVHQNEDEPYSDITLKLSSSISKIRLSNLSPS